MKYIIDIPDEAIEFMGSYINVFVEPEFKIGDCKHYALRICKDDITPYTEPDEDEIRQKVEQEVWEFATICTKMDGADSVDVFGGFSPDSFTKFSYQEAKSKYNEWLKKNELHVGDEVLNRLGKSYIIYEIKNDSAYGIMFDEYPLNQECFSIYDTNKKTGRYFPEVAELLKKMRGEEQ